MPIDKIRDMIAFATPLRIISRPERLIIQDYRPTTVMLLCMAGFVGVFVLFVCSFFGLGFAVDSFAMWFFGSLSVVLLVLSFRGTIREVYVFDREADSYTFIRQFPHRREVIEGALSQFTGARVQTHVGEESDTYSVVLRQEGMFLTGVSEQTLREEVPVLNTFSNEAEIANAIDAFLHSSPKR